MYAHMGQVKDNRLYFYCQYREGTTVKTVFVPSDQLAEAIRALKDVKK